ncbi:response regulator [Candidatus Methylopumilus rimovensis]|jgi:PleD family two-component response regulator|uniref:Response regulator n=1 Tax=Candidatus Methylopumilus rimovensis TaxID=2588535 RepID=A0AAE6KP88_9PROT|nr:response regulator [Candidatus Methylopumilus rimovensis]QDD11984.1 response regulator [Candidatus Methylopumilus rimovensis]QDD13273.1 response regulator [Candidatus Methylopumilus rimovensis]
MNETDILNTKILIVDDAEANLKLLEDLLTREGFHQIISTTDSTRALDLFIAFQPDLILLDLMMPELDGYAVLEILSRHIPKDEYLPVLVLTADATIVAKRKALALGAKDFLTKPFDTIEAMLRVWNLLETRILYRQLKALNKEIKPITHSPHIHE